MPKALRRNPNKRWREESSSVAPSKRGREGTGVTVEEEAEAEAEALESVKVEESGLEAPEELEVSGEVELEVPQAEVKADTEVTIVKEVETKVETEAEDAEKTTETTEEFKEEAVPAEGETETVGEPLVEERIEENGSVAPDVKVSEDSTEFVTVPVEELNTFTEVESANLEVQDVEETGEAAEVELPLSNGIIEAADLSMVTDPGIEAEISKLVDSATDPNPDPEPVENGHTEQLPDEDALVASAENTASAYKSRTRRRSSVSSVDSRDDRPDEPAIGVPSTNRVSILYEDSSRRLCFDAAAVEKVRIHRQDGKIEVVLIKMESEDKMALPSGLLVSGHHETCAKVRLKCTIRPINDLSLRLLRNWERFGQIQPITPFRPFTNTTRTNSS